jgi:drug/metabolite transporter (DMT)-like permease
VYRGRSALAPVAAVLYALLPFVFALLWASSYVAAKIGLADATPFALVGARLAIAAAAAGLLIAATGRCWPDWRSWPLLLLGGALLHGLGLAMTHAALVAVDATPTALVHAFHPILTAALGTVLLGERFTSWQWLGVLLGFSGVLLGVPLSLGAGNLALLGLSLFGLTTGTLLLRRFCAEVPPFESTAVQLIGGGLMSVLLMLAFETPHWHWTAGFAAALAWNTLAMSILGMAIYNLMLDRHGAGRASSGFFIVPGASALLGYLLLNEHVSAMTLVGLAASTLGVILVWRRRRPTVAVGPDRPPAVGTFRGLPGYFADRSDGGSS